MNLKSLIILLIIMGGLIPVYFIYKYLQQLIRPRESLQKLLIYMLAVFLLIFLYTYVMVLVIKLVFPDA